MADNTFGGKEKASLLFILKKAMDAAINAFLTTQGCSWIVRKIAVYIADHYAETLGKPIIDAIFIKIGYTVDVIKGEVVAKKVQNAQSVNDWNDSIDSGM